MTYDEVLEVIGRGQREDWLVVGGARVYKGDLNLRIEEQQGGLSGTEFDEPWLDVLPKGPKAPKRLVFWVYYGVNRIMEVHTVLLDGRTIVPFPDQEDRFSMDSRDYSFGKIVEEYPDTPFSLDVILKRAGIAVR